MNNAFAGDTSTSLPFVLSSWRSQDTRHCILDPTDSTTSLWLRLQVELRVRPNCFDSWVRIPSHPMQKTLAGFLVIIQTLGGAYVLSVNEKMKLEWAQESQVSCRESESQCRLVANGRPSGHPMAATARAFSLHSPVFCRSNSYE